MDTLVNAPAEKPQQMTRRSFHCPDDVWHAAVAKAAGEGTNVAAVLRDALADYVAQVPADA